MAEVSGDTAFNTLQKSQNNLNDNTASSAVGQGLKLSDLARQNTVQAQSFQDAQAARQSMQNRVTIDPDTGHASLDIQGVSDDLMKQNPMLRNQIMKTLGTDDIDLANQRMQKNQQFMQQLEPDGSNLQDVKQAAIKAGLVQEWKGVPDYGGPNTIWAIKQGAQTLSSQLDNHMTMLKMKNDRFMKGVEKGIIPPEFLGGQEPAGLGTGQENQQPQRIQANSPFGHVIPTGPMDAEAQKAYDDALGARKQNDPAYASAGSNLLAVKNAMSIFDKYKDLNSINTQDQNILAGEAAKAIKGGASPSKDEVEALLPENIASKGAGMWAKISSQPIPTNNAEYYNQLKNYFEDLRANSVNTIKSAHDYAAQTAIARGIAPQSLAIKQKAADKEINDLAYGQKTKPAGFSPDVLNYAKIHKISPDQAQAVKNQRIGGQ